MSFFRKSKKFNPYDESILKTFSRLDKKVTPSEVAKYLKIHPNTAKKRIKSLSKEGYLSCRTEGKRLYCERGRKLPVDY